MKRSTKVSVVIAVYNGGVLLRQALESVVKLQEYRDFEVIAVDDASTDCTAKMLREFADIHPFIRILRNDPNRGLTNSLNLGVAYASGEYIARQDADDLSHARRLLLQVQYLDAHPEVGFAGSSYVVIDEEGREIFTSPITPSSRRLSNSLKRRNLFAHGSVMFRRALFAQVGGYRSYFRYSQDYDLWLRMLEVSSAGALADPLYYLRVQANSISHQKQAAQAFYAQQAQVCAQARKDGRDDSQFLLQPFGDSDDSSDGTAEAALTRAIYLLKAGLNTKARIPLNQALNSGNATIRRQAQRYLLYSYVPAPCLAFGRRVKDLWEHL